MEHFEHYVCTLIAHALGKPSSEISLATSIDCPQWDSLAVVAVLSQIEAAVGKDVSNIEIEDLIRSTSVAEIAEKIGRALKLSPHTGAQFSAQGIEDGGHTVRNIRPNCRQLFFIYRGRGGILTPRPSEFVHQTGIDRRNFVIFDDALKSDYLHGISAEIPTFARFLSWQALQQSKHFPHIDITYCLGASAGAIAAILSGYFLKVPIVWAFSLPSTRLDRYGQHYLHGLSTKYHCNDFRDLLQDSNQVTEYRLFYNEEFEKDRQSAEQLMDCPGVKLFPQSGSGHLVISTMASAASLRNLLVPFEATSGS